MGVVLAVLSMVLAGVGSLFFKESSSRMGATRTTFLYYLFGLFLSGVIGPLVASEKDRMSRAGVGWAALAALALSLSVLCFNSSLRHIKVSTASTIYSFEFVVTILVAVALQKEVLETKEWVAAGLAVAAIILYVM
jgi:drug/metabolite transporter (DMT)-like permease